MFSERFFVFPAIRVETAVGTLTYRESGVDIAAGDAFVDAIKGFAKRTRRPEVMSGIGGFGSAFLPSISSYREPVLVSGTDGVGTKLLLAHEVGVHGTVGIDLVAMCVNDILTMGAEPLFFLDYLATGKLKPEVLSQVVEGISEGCLQSGCALVGGETAELPDMYADGVYDLAGFAVGIVERDRICGPEKVADGDRLIGIASSGVHSNGFSLVRKVIRDRNYDLSHIPSELDAPLAEILLEPTSIYVKPVLEAMKAHPISAMAHITGGGIPGNLARIIPDGLGARVHLNAFPRPPVFQWLLNEGVELGEALDVFNMGLGLVLVVPEQSGKMVLEDLQNHGLSAFEVGQIKSSFSGVQIEGTS